MERRDDTRWCALWCSLVLLVAVSIAACAYAAPRRIEVSLSRDLLDRLAEQGITVEIRAAARGVMGP